MKYVIFNLHGEEYGFSIFQVKEIIKVSEIRPLPHLPGFIEGLMRIRSHSLLVVDLAKKFGLKNPVQKKEVLVVFVKDYILGLLVDSTQDVFEIDAAQIDRRPRIMGEFSYARHIEGIAHRAQNDIVLLDASSLLTPDEERDLEKIGSAP